MTKFNHLSVKERRGKKRKLDPKTFYLEFFRQNACRFKNNAYLCIRNRERAHSMVW